MDCKTCKEIRARQMYDAEHSPEWAVSKELAKVNKRWAAIAVASLVLWFITLLTFVLLFISKNHETPQGKSLPGSITANVSEQGTNVVANCDLSQTPKYKKKKQTQIRSAV